MKKIDLSPAPYVWHVAHLTPQAQSIFGEDWYPPEARGTKSQTVFFTRIENKVIVASRPGKCRILTTELASSFLTEPVSGIQKATKAQMTALNSAKDIGVILRNNL